MFEFPNTLNFTFRVQVHLILQKRCSRFNLLLDHIAALRP